VDGLGACSKALDRIGSAVLGRLGYSEPMIGETKRQLLFWARTRAQAVSRRVPLISASGRALIQVHG
jgi:hypothetical protein